MSISGDAPQIRCRTAHTSASLRDPWNPIKCQALTYVFGVYGASACRQRKGPRAVPPQGRRADTPCMRAWTFLLGAAASACAVGLLTSCWVMIPVPHDSSSYEGQQPKGSACHQGIFYYDNEQYDKAYHLLSQSAAANNPCGLNNLGNYYFEGKAVPKDLPKAIALWRRSAASGYPGAQYNLGVLFGGNEGVAADLPRALKLLKAAAHQGYFSGPSWNSHFSTTTATTKQRALRTLRRVDIIM